MVSEIPMEAVPAEDVASEQVSPTRWSGTLATSFGTSLAIQGLNVLTGILLARSLGPQGRGELAAVMLWPAILATMGGLGVAEATAFYAARNDGDRGTIVGSVIGLGLAQAVVLAGAGALVIPVALSAHYDSEAIHAAYLFLAFIPLNLLSLYLTYALSGFQRFGGFQLLRLLVVALAAVGLGALALMGSLRVTTVVPVYLGANLLTVLTAAVAIRRTGIGPLHFSTALSRKLLGYGLRSHLGTVAGSLNERLDQLVISVFLAPAKLGLYVVAVTLTSATSLVGGSVSYIALPVIAREPDGPQRAAIARRFTSLTLLASVAVTIPLLAFTPTLIEILFGSAFRGVAGVARVLLLAGIVLSVNRALGAILRGTGRPLDAGLGEAVALIVTVGGLATLLPVLGLMGAALASVLAYGVSAAWMASRTARAFGIRKDELLVPRRAAFRVPLGRVSSPSFDAHGGLNREGDVR